MDDQSKWPFGQIDVLFSFVSLLLGILGIVLLSMNPPAMNNPDSLPPPGSLAMMAAWPDGNIDVDIWVQSPDDNKPVGYSRKDGTVCSLLRDDLGVTNDGSPLNVETTFCRALPPGEYVVNLHGFSIPQPVLVHIEVALNGSLLVKTDMEIRQKQERTVIRFTLDGHGKVVSTNTVFKALRSAQ